MSENEYLEDSHVMENIYKFIDGLPDDYVEKEEVKANINSLPVNKQKMTIAQYGKAMQNRMNVAQQEQLQLY